MNWMAGTGFIALAGGLLWFFVEQKPADVYDMPVEQAYGLLVNFDFSNGNTGRYEGASIQETASGNGSDKVTWNVSGSHMRRSCELALAPFENDPARTHVTVTCNGGGAGDGAASGITHNMHRNGIIERVDAALTGRPFDVANAGETAHRWPGDGVDGSYGTAVGRAIEMDRQMQSSGGMEVIEDDLRVRETRFESYE